MWAVCTPWSATISSQPRGVLETTFSVEEAGLGLVQEPEPEEGASEQCDQRVGMLPAWPAPPAAGPLNPALLWSNGRASCQPFPWSDMLSASFHPCGLVGMRMWLWPHRLGVCRLVGRKAGLTLCVHLKHLK